MEMVIAADHSPSAEQVDLLARARAGDAEAFGGLAKAHETRLYRQAFALCGEAFTAEDLTVETLVEAWKSLGRYTGACRLSTWLYAILLHRYQISGPTGRPLPAPDSKPTPLPELTAIEPQTVNREPILP